LTRALARRRLAALCFCLAAAAGFAQAAGPSTPLPPAPPPSTPSPSTPEEYKDEEFSRGLKALRRGEIILFGSFPLTLFLSYETYDIYRYFANDRLPQYRPWPARPPDAVAYQDWETAGVLISAVSLSLSLALTDYLVGKIRERRTAKHRSPDR
jgi:hypothetical protein